MDKVDCQLSDCTLCPLYTAIMNVIDKDIILPTAPEGVEKVELTRIKLNPTYKKLAEDVAISKEQFLAGMLEGKEIDGKPAMCNFFNLYKDWLSLIYNIISFTQPAMQDYNFGVLYIQDTNDLILLPTEQELAGKLNEME
jgi:hypothetical protein